MIQIVKYNKPRSGSGAVSASGAGIALSSLAGLLTQQQLATILEGYLLKETFDDLFVKESDGKGGYRIKAKYALYSNQYLSCLGNNPDAGTVELGATTLGGLNNVAAAADEVSAAAKVLVREAGAASWTLKSLSDIVGLDTAALATYLSSNGYAKQSWVEAKGYLTQQSLAGYALESWVRAQGYLTGITKAQVEAVLTGNVTSHTHSQYLTSVLAAQTYQPIGDYATNTALNSAVSSLNTAIGKKLDAATFDDLFVKESDGHGGYRIKAKYALYSNQYLSCLGNNPDAGTTTPSTPGVDLDAVAEYLTQQGYATQAWVQAQGYLKAADLSAYALADNAYLKTQQNLKGNAHTVASLTAVANSSDSWVNNYSFSLVNNNNALNFYVGGVQNERQALIQSGHSSNGYAQALGALHLNKLGGAVYINNSLALNAANVGTYAVTLDTPQVITGYKKFTAYETEHGSRVTATGLFDTFANWPHFLWHVAGTQWTKAVMDTNGGIHFVAGAVTGLTQYRAIAAANFVRPGGTSSQFLKADGSVDGNSYLTAHQSLDYIRVLDTRNAATTTSMAQQLTAHFKGNDKIGLADGGLYTGLLHLQPWADASGGSAHDIAFTVNGNMWLRTGAIGSAWGAWRKVLDTNNYASTLDTRYVKKTGDTMTGALLMTANVSAAPASQPTALSSGRLQAYGTLNINGNTDNSGTEYVNITAGHGISSSTADGLSIGTSTLTWQNNTIWHAGNDGAGSGLDADLLDGQHNGHLTAKLINGSNAITSTNITTPGFYYFDGNPANISDGSPSPGGTWNFSMMVLGNTAARTKQLAIEYISGRVYSRVHVEENWSDWKALAFTSDNVASATRLQGTYSLWGQNFYGNNVSGNMTGVGNINTAAAPIGTIYASNWYRSIGATGWYNETYGGGWHMDNATWIKSWNKPVYIAHVINEGASGFGVGLRCYNGSHTSIEVQGGAYTMGLGCHSNGSWYWWRGTSSGKGYVMQYDGTTWAFNGVIKTSRGMYSDGYMSCLGQNTSSDLRLKHIMGDAVLTLDMIADAPAKVFRWLYGPFAGRVAVGTIAQYWQQYLEPVVSKRPDDYLQMDYGVTATVGLINLARIVRDGLTDHERRILALESENKELKSEINELKRRLAA